MLACLKTSILNCAHWHVRRGNTMKRLIGSTFLKSIFLGLLALVIIGVSKKAALADEVTISGSTTGSIVGSASGILTFSNGTFTGTTAFGFGSLSGANTLGTLFLTPTPLNPLSGTFTLNITFTAPTGITGG